VESNLYPSIDYEKGPLRSINLQVLSGWIPVRSSVSGWVVVIVDGKETKILFRSEYLKSYIYPTLPKFSGSAVARLATSVYES
jgi:hypothetical protein